MKKQVKKLVVLLGVAGAFVLMSFNEPRWFAGIYDVKIFCSDHGRFVVGEETYCGHGDFVKLSETQYSYYGYCKCDPGWFGDRCEFYEDDL